MKKIATCLWFNTQAEEAAKFYTTVFSNSAIGETAYYGESSAKASGQEPGSVMTVELRLEDLPIQCLNGGPHFKFTPALSFFVNCANEQEINEKWAVLSQGGLVRMELAKYDWAEKYGWTTDRFGVEWQLILAPDSQTSSPKISPAFLFVDSLFGKGEEALQFYTSIFPKSKIETKVRDEKTKTLAHCSFELFGQRFVLMEGAGQHGYTFSNATSIVINCETQSEIDGYWEKLSQGGQIEQCGWLKDKFGVSWQIVPSMLGKYVVNPKTSERVMTALLKMKKLDIPELERAAI